MSKKKFDFSGYATKCDILCSDGKTIAPNAFLDQDGMQVPLVWNHEHDSPDNVIGTALLHAMPDGMYAYCNFCNTDKAQYSKELVQSGCIDKLSIYANKLKYDQTKKAPYVTHGVIREVSLVLAGANPGAYIDTVSMSHSGDPTEDEAIIYYGSDSNIVLEPEYLIHSNNGGKKMAVGQTVEQIYESLDDSEKMMVDAMLNEAYNAGREDGYDDGCEDTLDDIEEEEALQDELDAEYGYDDEDYYDDEGYYDDDDEDDYVEQNAFDNYGAYDGDSLAHSVDLGALMEDAMYYGSLKKTFLQHGIQDIQMLFPDNKNIWNVPQFIKEDSKWVTYVMSHVRHTPFAKIKTIYADIREDEARAKGYIKGNMKLAEIFPLLQRTTDPKTVYKKQDLDRDDYIDITNFDVLAWLKGEMREKLDEELARAFLIGDGRDILSPDKINEQNIRPIWTDADLYTIKYKIEVKTTDTSEEKAKKFIDACIRSRNKWQGTGTPALFTTIEMMTEMLLIKDSTGRDIYKDKDELKKKLMVSEIVTVPPMTNKTRTVDGKELVLGGLIMNLSDYNVGADKGGSVNMFEDFDIDFNKMKYLIETRCSGANVKPLSAIALEIDTVTTSSSSGSTSGGSSATPTSSRVTTA